MVLGFTTSQRFSDFKVLQYYLEGFFKRMIAGNTLTIQWWELSTCIAVHPGSITGWGIKTPQATSDCWALYAEFWVQQAWARAQEFASKKFPGNADTADLGTTLWANVSMSVWNWKL